MMGTSRSGLDLNEQFFQQVVEPLLAAHFPRLQYAAARLGSGSDVLGFDDVISQDHDWGIRMQIFLTPADAGMADVLHELLRRQLPVEFGGVSVHFGPADGEGTRLLAPGETGAVDHRIEIVTVAGFAARVLGRDPMGGWTAVDWLLTPQQLLLSLTAGRVFRDDHGELGGLREMLAYFPRQIWYYLLRAQWRRVAQEQHFLGRTGDVGDDLGSRLLAGRLVHDLMMLSFLLERKYAPYPKWFGSAFQRLAGAEALAPQLETVLTAADWRLREAAFVRAAGIVLARQNELGLTAPFETEGDGFHGRPYRIIDADGAVAALDALIDDPEVCALPTHLGGVDQISDNTDLRSYPEMFGRLKALYG